MGWKSTVTITREAAIALIINRALSASDSQLADALENLGFGDDHDLPYYGRNFMIGTPDESEEN